MDPNFPTNLNIKPLVFDNSSEGEDRFGVQAQQDAIQLYGIAGRVWEAASTMNTYLDPASPWVFDPPPFTTRQRSGPLAMVELGSGTGVVAALIATLLGPEDILVATDLPAVCPLLKQNLLKGCSEGGPMRVEPLAWGVKEHAESIRESLPQGLTHVICSDLVYFPELLPPLLRSLLHLTSKDFSFQDSTPTIIISYMIRSHTKEAAFWSAFGLWFSYSPVLAKSKGDKDAQWDLLGTAVANNSDPCFVFTAKRRPESLEWTVPDSDQELMDGVGANGSPSRKGDATFETLLLLAMDSS